MAWEEYLAKTANNEPSKLLLEALSYVSSKGNVLDLGAGALNEADFLSGLGYSVTAVDSNPDVQEYLAGLKHLVHLEIKSFDAFSFPSDYYVVVNARYSLPFNKPETFMDVFSRMTNSLKIGGVFVGQLFGTEDEWSNRTDMNFHTKKQMESLLTAYKIHKLVEKKGVRPTATGPDKFWHIFDVIAEKK